MTLPVNLLKSRNDVAGLLAMLYSPEGLRTFGEIADNSFKISWGELTSEEARALLLVLGAAEQMQVVIGQGPQSLSFMPIIVLKGLTNAHAQLSPYRTLLQEIEAGGVPPLEAKIRAGEISISQHKGVSMSVDQLSNLLVDAA